MENIQVLCHSSIKITGEYTIYVDPFKIDTQYNDADYIFITHAHYDHFSEEDIQKVRKNSTRIIITADLEERVTTLGFAKGNIQIVIPNKTYQVGNLAFKTIPAYNINKQFHPKENGWVGYILSINETTVYIAGDTDITEEAKKVKCDIALVPVGGTYTMNADEAASLVLEIQPKMAIPTHYKIIVGTKEDAEDFCKKISRQVPCEIPY